eukprot:387735-Pyramimonas_sp.AAC.1
MASIPCHGVSVLVGVFDSSFPCLPASSGADGSWSLPLSGLARGAGLCSTSVSKGGGVGGFWLGNGDGAGLGAGDGLSGALVPELGTAWALSLSFTGSFTGSDTARSAGGSTFSGTPTT